MSDKISDNVGKKIVEALKMQNQPIEEPLKEMQDVEDTYVDEHEEVYESEPEVEASQPEFEAENDSADDSKMTLDVSSILNGNSTSEIDNIFQNTLNQNIGNLNAADVEADFEYPNNVLILTHLISKLPAGVTKQTGAMIIRQTMEALGIPMKSVIAEAQQVQEALTSKARECQKSIIDYKKQIATLEVKGLKYQKKAVSMNDVINLFMSIGV